MEKILVAYDGGDEGRRALALAARLAIAFGSRLDVVSVVPEGFGSGGERGMEPAIEHARRLVEARAILRRDGIDAGLVEPAGDPARTIERLAADGGYDALILGAGAHEPGAEHVVGGVVSHVARHATTTVIVAR